jgi:hypothetical protein
MKAIDETDIYALLVHSDDPEIFDLFRFEFGGDSYGYYTNYRFQIPFEPISTLMS